MQITDIPELVERLGRAVEDQPSEVRIWTVAMLASRLGLTAVMTAHDDCVQRTEEIGEMWADMVADALEEEPRRQAGTLRAAYRVIERLLAAVPSDNGCQAAGSH